MIAAKLFFNNTANRNSKRTLDNFFNTAINPHMRNSQQRRITPLRFQGYVRFSTVALCISAR